MNLKFYLIFIFLFILAFTAGYSLAATRISQQNGDWSSSATWGGVIPAANDDIIVSAGTIVRLNTSLSSSLSYHNLDIESGGSLIVGIDKATLRLAGNLRNEGVLNLWQSSTLQSDIVLHGNSFWSGNGNWNLSTVNVQSNSLDVAEGIDLTINTSITAYDGASFNKENRYDNITINIGGSINSMIPASADFYYGHLVISKTAGTVSFSPSTSANTINLLGNLTLANSTDRLVVEANNTLRLNGNVSGTGVISGLTTSTLVVDNLEAPAINPLRLLSGTSFREVIINRRAGVTLASGFIIRESLQLNNSSQLTLPGQTLTLGVNGTNPTAGKLSGDGSFIGSTSSSMSIRGKDTASVNLRFDQSAVSKHTINNLIIDRRGGTVGIASGSLLIRGKLDISDQNLFAINSGNLILNIVPRFIGSGCLSGSKGASLVVAGTDTVSYSLIFNQVTPFGNTLRSYTQSRESTITLFNTLNIVERVNLSGNSSVLVSNGNLTLLSTKEGTGAISALLNNTDVRGDVNVQVYISGNNENLKFRGYRSLSSPLNDDLMPVGRKSFEQLKKYIIITGPGGVANGFDQGGNAQPFAQTLMYYNPLLSVSGFTPVQTISEALTRGTGFLAFYRGSQQGSYALNFSKLNSPYTPPEAATIVYQGPINKFNIPPLVLRAGTDSTDAHRGYNLIGNPYPSAIDWTRVSKSIGVNEEVIILKPGGGTATYLNGISNNGGSSIIQPGQGFYVRTEKDGNTVSFSEECKSTASPARLLISQTDHLNSDKGVPSSVSDHRDARQLVKLRLSNDDDIDELTIVFEDGQSSNADYNDAMYFSGSSVSLACISADGKRLAINFLPVIEDFREVNLSINALSSGSHSLSFTHLPDRHIKTFLKDALAKDQLTEVTVNDSYCFSIDKNDPLTFGDKRFTLVFKSEEPAKIETNSSVKAYPNPVGDRLFFELPSFLNESIQVSVCDMKGERQQRSEIKLTESHSVDVSQLLPGIYIARIRTVIKGRPLGDILFIKQ